MLPIRNFDKGFNTNNIPLAMTAFSKTGVVILDEFAPHVWSGPKAVATWLNELGANDAKAGITGEVVTFGKPNVETTSGAAGYVVTPVEYHYKLHGKAIHEPATMTFALKKTGSAWLIAGWSWNGTVPKPGP